MAIETADEMQRVEGARCFQTMVPMRDGARMNTFVYLPEEGGPTYPVILHRTPYGITSPEGQAITDPTRGWLPDPAAPLLGPILRGWKEITRHGYAAVYQDCRGRYGSEGEDHVYGDDAPDGHDALEWIAAQPWSNQQVGLSGASAGATTALAAASTRHPQLKAFFTQVGGSSIYDDVVYEGNSIEMERLWLWVSNNIPGLSATHRAAVMERTGLSAERLDDIGPFGPRPLQGPRQRPPRPAALPRLRGMATPPAERLSGLLRVAALPRRDPPPPRARRLPGRPQLPGDDRRARLPRHLLVRHLPDQRRRRLPGDPGPRPATSASGSARTPTTSSTRPSSGCGTRTSSGSTTGCGAPRRRSWTSRPSTTRPARGWPTSPPTSPTTGATPSPGRRRASPSCAATCGGRLDRGRAGWRRTVLRL